MQSLQDASWEDHEGPPCPMPPISEVGFAYVVGSITASLGQLRAMSEEALRAGREGREGAASCCDGRCSKFESTRPPRTFGRCGAS